MVQFSDIVAGVTLLGLWLSQRLARISAVQPRRAIWIAGFSLATCVFVGLLFRFFYLSLAVPSSGFNVPTNAHLEIFDTLLKAEPSGQFSADYEAKIRPIDEDLKALSDRWDEVPPGLLSLPERFLLADLQDAHADYEPAIDGAKNQLVDEWADQLSALEEEETDVVIKTQLAEARELWERTLLRRAEVSAYMGFFDWGANAVISIFLISFALILYLINGFPGPWMRTMEGQKYLGTFPRSPCPCGSKKRYENCHGLRFR